MALDTIVEIAIEAIGKRVIVRVFYFIGTLSLRLLTLGRYPPAGGLPHNRQFVAVFGVVPIILLLLLATGQFG